MQGISPDRLNTKKVQLQDMLQQKLAKTAKKMVDEVKHERKVISGIIKDIGFDIIKEKIVPERVPMEFCYSMPAGNLKNLFSGE